MSEFESTFLREVDQRRYIYQGTDNAMLDRVLSAAEQAGQPVACYIGFDCTATSLHVGSLIQIMVLRHWQRAGHKPIVLMGGGTTKVGDPTGKDQARAMLTDEQIAANMSGIKQVFAKFLTFEETFDANSTAAFMVNNADWLEQLNYIEFLRDYGRLFSVNRMLSMDSVKQRLDRESHMSFLEFNYMILQAYDFVELNQRYDVRLQIGGSDQWGNIISGLELMRKKFVPWIENIATEMLAEGHNFDFNSEESNIDPLMWNVYDTWKKLTSSFNSRHTRKYKVFDKTILKQTNQQIFEGSKNLSAAKISEAIFEWDFQSFGLTTPLLTTSSGTKMGKTAGGAVWLNADLYAPYDYWQFWRNTEDADVGKFLRLFTELPLTEIERLEGLEGAGINEAKKVLATEATALLHGREAAEAAAETARQTFEQGVTADTLPQADVVIEGDMQAYLLFVKAGLAASGGEARRLIQGGGARINDEKVEDASRSYSLDELLALSPLKLSSGKKKHILLNITTG